MKIYFEDDFLRKSHQLSIGNYYVIDAAKGYSYNMTLLGMIQEREPDATIYTNQIAALSNEYCWNEELKVPELYIRAGEHMVFTRIDELTEKELRFAHNLMKMYINGAFNV